MNERPRSVAAGTSVAQAVAAGDPELAGLLRAGGAYVTDGVGREVEVAGAVFPGAIYRVVRSARRERETPE